jgi:hypothetical protein
MRIHAPRAAFRRARASLEKLGRRAVDDRDELDDATQTTASGLIRLASVIAGLVREGEVDTRFGGKLLRRLDKEAKRVSRQGAIGLADDERDALFGAIAEFDVALRHRDAASLVEANARLRDSEDAKGKRRKQKKSDEA